MAQYFGKEIDLYIFNQTVMKKHYVADFGGRERPLMHLVITRPSVCVCVRACVCVRVCTCVRWVMESNSPPCGELPELSQDYVFSCTMKKI